jgi:hypothetical protein
MDRATSPRRRRGHDTYPEHNRLESGEQYSPDHDEIPSKGPLARLAAMGALAVLLIAACASAFSMLIWEPAGDPPAAASPVVSGRVGREASATRPGVQDIRRRTLHRAGRYVSSCSVLRPCPSNATSHGVRTRLRDRTTHGIGSHRSHRTQTRACRLPVT